MSERMKYMKSRKRGVDVSYKRVIKIVLVTFLVLMLLSSSSADEIQNHKPYIIISSKTHDISIVATETNYIIQPYNNMTETEFSETMESLKLSRTNPYYYINKNVVYFGDVYFDHIGNADYHGIYRVEWNNNNLPIQPLFNINIGISFDHFFELLSEKGIYENEVEIQLRNKDISTSIVIEVINDELSDFPYHFFWQFDFSNRTLTKITFCVQKPV